MKLVTGNWRIEIGNRNPGNRNWKIKGASFHFPISSFYFPVSAFCPQFGVPASTGVKATSRVGLPTSMGTGSRSKAKSTASRIDLT